MRNKTPRLTKNGFTLLEVMISIAIAAIVAVAVVSAFAFGTRVYRNETQQFDNQTEARIAINYLSLNTRHATHLEIINIPNQFDVPYSYIYFDSTSKTMQAYIYSNGAYLHRTVSRLVNAGTSSFEKVDSDTLRVTVVTSSGDQTYVGTLDIELLNLELQYPIEAIVGTKNSAIKFLLD